MTFTPDSFGAAYPHDQLLEAAARLTLRLVPRCEWVQGYTGKDDDDPDSWDSLYDRIIDLMGAYVHSPEGEDKPEFLLSLFAANVAYVIAKEPSLLAAVAAHLAAKQDDDP